METLTDIALFPVVGDDVGKALVHGNILLEGGRLEELGGLRGVGDDIVEARPQDLVAELVVALLKLVIRDPDR